jgi:hypothetical protein
MNLTLKDRNVTESCAELTLDVKVPVEILEYEPEKKLNVFHVSDLFFEESNIYFIISSL